MLETKNSTNSEKSLRLQKVQEDLLAALSEFSTQSEGINTLSEKMDLSAKTLRRVLKGSHEPSFNTILKFYKYILKASDDRETVLKMPEILSGYVLNESESLLHGNNEAVFTDQINNYLKSDSVFRSIYLDAYTGKIYREKVGYDHGQHGLKTLDFMLTKKILKEISPSIYSISTNRASLDHESSILCSQYLIENKFNIDKCNVKGENFYDLIFSPVDLETFNELLKIDWESKQKKNDILKSAKKGEIKYWSINFSDTLSKDFLYEENKEVLQ